MDNEKKQPIEMWAKVELMGHLTMAGKVTEVPMFGTALLRLDVPETDRTPAHTEFFGGGSIYRITPCGEAEARMVAGYVTAQPIQPYMLKQLRAPFEQGRLAQFEEDREDELEF
jgi:hypothetical protein